MTGKENERIEAFFPGKSEMARLMRAFDWSRTSLGPVETWPRSLLTSISICLDCAFPIVIFWGPELILFYNDEYRPALGPKHPRALGQPGSRVWSEIWDVVGPMLSQVMERGEATRSRDLMLHIDRGYPEEAYFSFSYSPIHEGEGKIGGVFCPVIETTQKVIGERRLRTLRDLAAGCQGSQSEGAAYQSAVKVLAANPRDVPFALVYRVAEDRSGASLEAAAGIAPGAPAAPRAVALEAGSAGIWCLGEVARSGKAVVMTDLARSFDMLPMGAWKVPPHSAVVLPILLPGQERPRALLVAAVSPMRALDADYRTFLELVATQTSSGLADAEALEQEHRRAEALAELDRAKTAFFSNVSHEFRTPLTLMLGPAEELLGMDSGFLSPRATEEVNVIYRNALRLQKLVNTLLDFSRIEAGRIQSSFVSTDLASLTRELASVFRSAIEKAGLRLTVSCEPLSEPVYVDRDMWEKIVLNLISNAFKFTFEGEIEVKLTEGKETIELSVRDTGTGIPRGEIAHLFERFHRIKDARARTHEGTGIGLALVSELVKLHGGSVGVDSVPGEGTTFTVTLRKGSTHLPAEHIGAPRNLPSTAVQASLFVEEALRWLPDTGTASGASPPGSSPAPLENPGTGPRGRVLLADDNADMRDYVRRLLAERYEVETVRDGEAALAAAGRQLPDLVLADVMMPGLDGFELLRALREGERTRTIPVVLLSARAGEEARVEGMHAGADDYIVKPFNARELLARVDGHVRLARARREVEYVLRDSEARLRSFADWAPAMLWVTDPDGSCSFLSRGWYEFTGEKETRGLEFGCLDAVHPDDRAAARDAFLGASRRREPFAVDYRLRRADGEYRWVIDTGRPRLGEGGEFLGFIGSVIDVHERKRAEEALRERTAQFETLFNQAPLGVFVVDADLRIRAMNPVALPAFGDIPDLVGRDFEEVLRMVWAKEYADEVMGVFRRTLETGEPYVCPERTERRLDRGTTESYEWRLDRMALPGSRHGVVCHFRDISIEIQAREALRASEQALRNEHRRKDEFLAMLAHELRNPLAPIKNAAQVLRMFGPPDSNLAWSADVIERQVMHLVRLVDDLLDVSRIASGKVTLRKVPTDVQWVVASAIEGNKALVEARKHCLVCDVAHVSVSGDPARLVQVMSNLINNAAKYMKDGGKISILARKEAGKAVIKVSDQGEGIPAALLPHVFDMFTQGKTSLDRTEGGLGIGLTVVERLVKLHGGSIEARSEPGKGSEFTVVLPALDEAGTGAPRAERMPSRALNPRRILVVDDNVDSAESMSLLLRALGHEVQVSFDGPSAIRETGTFSPEIILLDIGLPRMDGFAVARRIRALEGGDEILIIAMTGYGREEDKARAREAGFDLHLTKPIRMQDVQEFLETRA